MAVSSHLRRQSCLLANIRKTWEEHNFIPRKIVAEKDVYISELRDNLTIFVG